MPGLGMQTMPLIRLLQFTTLAALLLLSPWLAAADAIQDEWDGVEKLVIIGDIHGDYDNYIDVLRDSGLVNRRGNWTGDETHLVQLGDVPDRGPDTARIIEHLQRLERQAQRDGGMVHVLIGNHEFMNVIGDLRYVHPGEYAALTSRNSSRFRDAYYQQTVQAIEARNAALMEAQAQAETQDEGAEQPVIIDEAFKARWYEQFPLGYVEHRLTWQPGGDFNNWVSTHNAIIRINDMLFMHAGLGPAMLGRSIRDINEQVRREILGQAGDPNAGILLGENEDGPLWYRGLAMNPEPAEAAHVQALLEAYGVNAIVVGHTPDLGVITPRFGGQVIIADTGISAYYGAHKASMVVQDGQRFALQQGEMLPLPADSDATISYLRQLLDLGAGSERLPRYLENLINPPVPDPAGIEAGESTAAEIPVESVE